MCFLSTQLTAPLLITYIRCMSDLSISEDEAKTLFTLYGNEILDYIKKDGTAKKAKKQGNQLPPQSNKFLATEQIYAMLIEMCVPFEVQHWKFGRLMSLIKYMNKKGKKGGGMSNAQWQKFANANHSRL